MRTYHFQPTNLRWIDGLISDNNKLPIYETSLKPFDFPNDAERGQSFRWVPLKQLTPDDVTLPIDKKVVPLLKSE